MKMNGVIQTWSYKIIQLARCTSQAGKVAWGQLSRTPIRERQRMGYTECQALYVINSDPQCFVLYLSSNWPIQNWPRAVG